MEDDLGERLLKKFADTGLPNRGSHLSEEQALIEAETKVYDTVIERVVGQLKVPQLNLLYRLQGQDQRPKRSPNHMQMGHGNTMSLVPAELDPAKPSPHVPRMPSYSIQVRLLHQFGLRVEIRRDGGFSTSGGGDAILYLLKELVDDIAEEARKLADRGWRG